MSLEAKIELLTEKVEELTAVLKGAKVTKKTDDDADDAGDDVGDEKPAKRKRRTKAEIAADEAAKKKASKKDDDGDDLGDDEGDDFGDDDNGDDGDSEMSADDIRELLMRVKDEKGADKARGILSEIGVKTIAQIPEKQYDKVVKLAKKLGVK